MGEVDEAVAVIQEGMVGVFEENVKGEVYQMIGKRKVWRIIRKQLSSIRKVLQLPKYAILRLLIYFHWDQDRLMEAYLTDPEATCAQAGIPYLPKEPPPQGDCLICFRTGVETYTMHCGHGPYCKECWKDHIALVANNRIGSEVLSITCIDPRCTLVLSYHRMEVLATPRDFKRYCYFLLRDYIEHHSELQGCPKESCHQYALLVGPTSKINCVEIQCKCKATFCFHCQRGCHRPISCEMLDTWVNKYQDDEENNRVLNAISKQCPHCGIATERIDGCNHMVCSVEIGGCGKGWCWMCRGDWELHGGHTGGYYSCNRYEATAALIQEDLKAQELKLELERYGHYYNRYNDHEVGEKALPTVLKVAEGKALEYLTATGESGSFWVDAAYLLADCRRFMKFSYVYGYFLRDKSIGKGFFEYVQGNAEGVTERLSMLFYNTSHMRITVSSKMLMNHMFIARNYIHNLKGAIENHLDVQRMGELSNYDLHVQDIDGLLSLLHS